MEAQSYAKHMRFVPMFHGVLFALIVLTFLGSLLSLTTRCLTAGSKISISRQLIKYHQEFERLQAVRKKQEWTDEDKTDEEIQTDAFDPASFGQTQMTPTPTVSSAPFPRPRAA